MTARFHRLDRAPETDPETQVVVAEALVPLRWWRGVSISLRGTAALTAMERFILEIALAFGASAPAEFEEVTDLPARLLPVLGRRLVAAGALERSGVPRDAVLAQELLSAQQLQTDRDATVDVVSLPMTGEVVMLDRGNFGSQPLLGWDKARVKPVSRYPVGTDLTGRTVAEILLAANGTTGIGRADLVSVDADTVAFPDGLCPVYRCTAHVSGAPAATVRLSIGAGAPTVPLAGVDRLVTGWSAADQAVADQPLDVWRTLIGREKASERPPQPRRTAPARWHLPINGIQAALLAASGRSLAVRAGLAIETDNVVVEVAIDLNAADSHAAAAIALDEAINAAVVAGSAAEVVRERLARAGTGAAAELDPNAVRNRAWQLGHRRLAYALREKDDFAYA